MWVVTVFDQDTFRIFEINEQKNFAGYSFEVSDYHQIVINFLHHRGNKRQ